MIFRQVVREASGCASYVIGSEEAGVCAVVDPGRDVEAYLAVSREKSLAITHVLDTHAHADHISGSRALAEVTGANLYLHRAYQPRYDHRAVEEGDSLELGEVSLRVIHAPGHRPDNMCLAVADTRRAAEPWLVLTGDSLFVGDVARPDLGVTPRDGAAELYSTLLQKILPLGDGVEVYPSHVAGSACGRAMSSKGGSTIGYERRFNLALQAASQQEFVEQLLRDLPPQPPNFPIIVAKNQGHLPVRHRSPAPLSAEEVAAKVRQGVLLLDVREQRAFGAGFIEAAVNVPLEYGGFASSAVWIVPPEVPIVVVVGEASQAPRAYQALADLGLDYLEGYALSDPPAWQAAGLPVVRLDQLSAQELRSALANDEMQLVDVRGPQEWAHGHIPAARNIPLAELQSNLRELDPSRAIAFVCNSGFSSGAAASMVKASGFARVFNVAGGVAAWRRAGFPLEARADVTDQH